MAPFAIAFEQWTCSMKRAHVNTFLARLRRRLLRITFLKNRDGVTAVEFALIGVPFLGLLCAIFQTGMVYFEGAILQETTQVASRAILTQSAAAGMTYGTFLSTYVCPPTSVLFNCSSLQASIQDLGNSTSTNWQAASSDYSGNFYNKANNTASTVINMPPAGDIAVVRIMYPMNQMAAIIAGTALRPGYGAMTTGQTTLANGQLVTMLVGVYAFRVEP